MKKIVIFCLFLLIVSTYLYSYEVNGQVENILQKENFIFLLVGNRVTFPVNPKVYYNSSTKFYAVRNNGDPELIKYTDLLRGDYIKCISKSEPTYRKGHMPEIYADTVIVYESFIQATVTEINYNSFKCSSSYKFFDEVTVKILYENSIRDGFKSEIKAGDNCYFTVNPVKNTVNFILVDRRNESLVDNKSNNNNSGKKNSTKKNSDSDSGSDIRPITEREECSRCSGEGKFPCYTCDQNGYYEEENLDWDAKGNAKIRKRRKTCEDCHGRRYIKCDDCGGKGYIIVRY